MPFYTLSSCPVFGEQRNQPGITDYPQTRKQTFFTLFRNVTLEKWGALYSRQIELRLELDGTFLFSIVRDYEKPYLFSTRISRRAKSKVKIGGRIYDR